LGITYYFYFLVMSYMPLSQTNISLTSLRSQGYEIKLVRDIK
jgi:hypothetical protein